VFTPEALVGAVRAERGIAPESIPPICVLDFDGDLNDWLVKNGLARHYSSWACFHTTMNVVKVDGVDCGIIPRTIGDPYVVLIAEQLCVSSARLIIGLTSAGRVLDSLPVPCLVIATSAIRDEGTSYHYLPPAGRVAGPSGIAESLESELRNLDLHLEQGCVWTTDAPYRETAEQFQR
jgi:uridine phosphorylase